MAKKLYLHYRKDSFSFGIDYEVQIYDAVSTGTVTYLKENIMTGHFEAIKKDIRDIANSKKVWQLIWK